MFKLKTADEVRISDWRSDVGSSDLGRRGWAVSVALVEKGEPVLGRLAAPARRELWVAQKGKGAWRNGEPLVASRRKIFSGARVPADQLPKVDFDLTQVHKPNSIALRMAMVAADEADLVATEIGRAHV